MSVIRAVFENGVFRPLNPVQLPDKTEVEFEPRPIETTESQVVQPEVRRILIRSYETGDRYASARHNEHQP